MAGFWFNRIHILQSLPAGELRTGRVLQTAILVAHPDAASRIVLCDVDDRESLRAVLVDIAAHLDMGLIPFIHLECHGSQDGLQLSSGEIVTWNEFRDLFTPLNVASRLNLFVSLASCHGDRLASAILLTEPAPVWALLGPRSVHETGALCDFFRTFFTRLLETTDLRAALNAAGGGLPTEGQELVLWPADYFFAFAFHRYVADYCSPTELGRRAECLAARLQQQRGWPVETRPALTEALRHRLRNLQPLFTGYLRTYLMLDRLPENHDRFTLNWGKLQSLYEQTVYGA